MNSDIIFVYKWLPKLLTHYDSSNWSYIGIIASDSNYGGAGLSAILTHASKITTKQKEFCIAFQYKLQQDWAADIADKVIDFKLSNEMYLLPILLLLIF